MNSQQTRLFADVAGYDKIYRFAMNKFGEDWTSMLSKGQSMAALTAIDIYHVQNNDYPTLDELVETIDANNLWINAGRKKRGIGDKHSCRGWTPYQSGGKFIIFMDNTYIRKKCIKRLLSLNVLNTRNYKLTSTRKKDNSILLPNCFSESPPVRVQLDENGNNRYCLLI